MNVEYTLKRGTENQDYKNIISVICGFPSLRATRALQKARCYIFTFTYKLERRATKMRHYSNRFQPILLERSFC